MVVETRKCAKCGQETPLDRMTIYRPRGTHRENLPEVMGTWCIPCRDAAMKSRAIDVTGKVLLWLMVIDIAGIFAAYIVG